MNSMKKHKTYKGKYTPKFPKKYKGNYKNIVYRSLWERKCMVYFDTNPKIISWSSEEIIIPYFDSVTKTRRRYYPDFLITVLLKFIIKFDNFFFLYFLSMTKVSKNKYLIFSIFLSILQVLFLNNV